MVMLTMRNVEDKLFHQSRNKELLTDIGCLVVITEGESIY